MTEISLKNGLSLSTDSMLHKLYNHKMYINMSSVIIRLLTQSIKPTTTPSKNEGNIMEIGRIETALNVTFYDKEPSSEMDYVKQMQYLKTQDRGNKKLNFLWNSVERQDFEDDEDEKSEKSTPRSITASKSTSREVLPMNDDFEERRSSRTSSDASNPSRRRSLSVSFSRDTETPDQSG